MPGAPDIAHEHGFLADERWSCGTGFEKAPFLVSHSHLIILSGAGRDVTSLASPRHGEIEVQCRDENGHEQSGLLRLCCVAARRRRLQPPAKRLGENPGGKYHGFV